jgi:hypothetical protein
MVVGGADAKLPMRHVKRQTELELMRAIKGGRPCEEAGIVVVEGDGAEVLIISSVADKSRQGICNGQIQGADTPERIGYQLLVGGLQSVVNRTSFRKFEVTLSYQPVDPSKGCTAAEGSVSWTAPERVAGI